MCTPVPGFSVCAGFCCLRVETKGAKDSIHILFAKGSDPKVKFKIKVPQYFILDLINCGP